MYMYVCAWAPLLGAQARKLLVLGCYRALGPHCARSQRGAWWGVEGVRG